MLTNIPYLTTLEERVPAVLVRLWRPLSGGREVTSPSVHMFQYEKEREDIDKVKQFIANCTASAGRSTDVRTEGWPAHHVGCGLISSYSGIFTALLWPPLACATR